jgi:hypothetical protein
LASRHSQRGASRRGRKSVDSNVKLVELPRSEVTLAALDILLENPNQPMNGLQLANRVEERLHRKVNYSGVLKQVRSYSAKPYWKLALVSQKKSALAFYAEPTAITEKLHTVVHRLYDLSRTLDQVSGLHLELRQLRESVLSDPYSDVEQVRAKRQRLESQLDSLLAGL